MGEQVGEEAYEEYHWYENPTFGDSHSSLTFGFALFPLVSHRRRCDSVPLVSIVGIVGAVAGKSVMSTAAAGNGLKGAINALMTDAKPETHLQKSPARQRLILKQERHRLQIPLNRRPRFIHLRVVRRPKIH